MPQLGLELVVQLRALHSLIDIAKTWNSESSERFLNHSSLGNDLHRTCRPPGAINHLHQTALISLALLILWFAPRF